MNEVLKALLKALGLPETDATTAEQAVSAVALLKDGASRVPADVAKALGLADTATAAHAAIAIDALKAKAEKVAGLNTEIAALKAGGGGEPDPTRFVSLKAFTDLHAEVATLRAGSVDREVDELLTAARCEGKCSPVVEEVWRGIGKADIAQLKALIDKTPGNPALAGQTQTTGKAALKADPNAAATADELAMCKSMGLSLEQFRAGAEAAA